ncbi:MAG: hypothetical protein M1165_00200, partial [Candidatus Pacearchaeota archaeon]|nr:hypothetical protein [Candidatus Pacearchaeota archaeon]
FGFDGKSKREDTNKNNNASKSSNLRGVICKSCGNQMEPAGGPGCYTCKNCGDKVGGCGL